MTNMRPYMVHDGDPHEGAVLAFAWSERQARSIAFPVIRDWNFDATWIDIRAKWMRDKPWIEALHTTQSEPFVIDDPPCCSQCELWGFELDDDGKCKNGCPEEF